MPAAPPTTFHWSEAAMVLGELAAEHELALDEGRRCFTGAALTVHPPLVFPLRGAGLSLAEYASGLPSAPSRHVVILMQAGAVALGLFEAGEARATRSFKRYVVRGRGRAQPTHLQTKGKSRYGSRLRLQNAQRLLAETNEKLREWHAEFGAFDQVYYNAPVRVWPTLFAARPGPPFGKDDPHVRIPLDLPRPRTDVLLRVYRRLSYGRVETHAEDAGDEG